MFGKVAVLMGGLGAEREVSLHSGMAVLAALKRQGIDAVGIDAVQGFVETLIAGKFDRVFIAMHGGLGEGGAVQGMLEVLDIPYTGSDVLSSALCMDKQRTKRIWQTAGLPTLPFGMVAENQDPAELVNSLNLPLAVKPIHEGSSVGVTKLTNFFDLYEAVKTAGQYGPVMLEQWVEGDDITVGILDNQPLPSIKITAGDNFYDYNAKYLSTETQYTCPATESEEEEHRLQKLAKQAFTVLGASGWGRVDLMRDKNGDYWLLEVNTIPGLTDTSLVPKAAKAVGISFDEVVIKILSETFERETTRDPVAKERL